MHEFRAFSREVQGVLAKDEVLLSVRASGDKGARMVRHIVIRDESYEEARGGRIEQGQRCIDHASGGECITVCAKDEVAISVDKGCSLHASAGWMLRYS
mmetsp:Transcript_39314/g.126191  ORF Transcript_39314/g.126191 Transcript_39314/m.126191 type:complete len:99 (+) Transcript_39314:505-801(+)